MNFTNELSSYRANELSRGFTLIELVIYIGIFSVVSVFLTGTFFTTLRINKKETSSNEVQSQLNLVLQTVQRLVRESSLIERTFNYAGLCSTTGPSCLSVGDPIQIPASTCNSSTGSFCGVVLRMTNPTLDPTFIYSRSDSGIGNVYIKQGTGAETTITNDKVLVDSFILNKNITSGSKDILKIDASVSYNTTDPTLSFTKAINSAVGRANAAVFDSDLLPNADDSFDVGQTIGTKRWRNGHFADDVTVGGNLGIGTTSPAQKLVVLGDIKISGVGTKLTFDDGTSFTSAGALTVGGGWTMDDVPSTDVDNVRLTSVADRVGIGTSTPTTGYKLDVNGATKIAGGLNVDNVTITGTCTGCGSGGINIVYRCVTAGTLPIGALTITTSNCGSTADTGLRVN